MAQETMEKINIAEILKDCPQGMELYSPVCGKCEFEGVDDDPKYPITVAVKTDEYFFLADGRYLDLPDAECLLFPSKDQRDWSKFQRPFKDGEIIYVRAAFEWVAIYNKESNIDSEIYKYVGIRVLGDKLVKDCSPLCYKGDIREIRYATEEEKQKLFDAIKDNGYKWNEETKTLEKLIEPKFKVGDRIKDKDGYIVTITEVNEKEECYEYESMIAKGIGCVVFSDEDDWELVPNKFDITTLVPFESKVLVREKETDVWQPAFYGFFNQHNKRFYTTSTTWLMCIPYNEDTKHLIGTKSDCNKYYKTWEELS